MTHTLTRTGGIALAFIACFAFALTAFAAVEQVSGDTSAGENQPGWLFNRDLSTQTPYDFVVGPSTIGFGSLYVEPITNSINGNSDKFIAELFSGMEIADLNSFSYDFLIGSGGDASDENHFYLNVYANFGTSSPDKFYDCRYNVVPSTGSTADWTTITFDPTQAYPVTTSGSSPFPCPAIPADMDLEDPEGAVVRVFALNVGDTSGSDLGLDGYYDNVVVDTDSGVTTYDFDPILDLLIGGGGHILKEEGAKKKDWLDVSFGLNAYDDTMGGVVGNLDVTFHNVNNDDYDKAEFNSTDLIDHTILSGNTGECQAAMNITALGTLDGEAGWKVIVRGGDSGESTNNDPDTLRVELFNPGGTKVYDTFTTSEFGGGSNCHGTARTWLDKGNLVINQL